MIRLLVLLLILLGASTAEAVTYYVSKQGNDANSCASAQDAGNTSNHRLTPAAGAACTANNSADVVNIGPGIYSPGLESSVIRSGVNASSRWRMVARNPARNADGSTISSSLQTVIRPAGSGSCVFSGTAVLAITGPKNFVEFDGIVFDANAICPVAIRFDSSGGDAITNIRFKNGIIRNGKPHTTSDAGSALVVGSPPAIAGPFNNIEIINNEVHDSGSANSCLSVDPSDSLIEGNFIHDCGNFAATSHHTAAAGVSWPQNNITVRNNVGKNSGAGCFQFSIPSLIYNNFCLFTGGGTKAFSGTAYGTGVFDITRSNQGQGSSVTSVKYWNNTSYGHFGGNDIACFRIGATSTGGDHEFRNNICYGADSDGDGLQLESGSGAVARSTNRCASGCDTTANPQFVDTGALASCSTAATCAAALRLTSSSPGSIRNGGTTVASVPTDYFGTSRPAGAYDLGAHEFISAPNLVVTPTSLVFNSTVGSAGPASQSLSVSDSASTGGMPWTAVSSESWLIVSPTSGTNAGTIDVSVNISGLAAGQYNADITVTASGATGSPDVIPVTLNLDPSVAPSLSVSPNSMSFSGAVGSSLPPQTFLVENTVAGTSMSWTASDDVGWLSVAPSSGTNTTQLAATVDTAGLVAGVYTGTITVNAPGASPSQGTIDVTLTILPTTTPAKGKSGKHRR